MPGGSPIVFGKYRLREARTFHNASFECAAWYEDIAVEPGEYEVRGNFEGSKLYWAHVTLPGIVVAAHFPSLFGGVAIGGGNPNDVKRIGTAGRYPMSCVYGYGIAQNIVQDYRTPWVLDPGFSVVPAGYDNKHSIYRSDNSKFEIATPAYHVVKDA